MAKIELSVEDDIRFQAIRDKLESDEDYSVEDAVNDLTFVYDTLAEILDANDS